MTAGNGRLERLSETDSFGGVTSPPKAKRRRLPLTVLYAAALLLLVFFAAGCGDLFDLDDYDEYDYYDEYDDDNEDYSPVSPSGQSTPPSQSGVVSGARYDPSDTWAVYWYLCGSDLESYGAFASDDLSEMMKVQLPDNVCVVIEAGGATYWHNGFDPDANSRYLYDSDGFRLLEKNPRANMSDANTLQAFLRYCNENFPADHEIVVFWDHGGGSVAGVILDEFFDDDSLSLTDIREAFEATSTLSKSNPPYEMVGFDACLMATVDMVDALNGVARYMVASEDLEPGVGWDYTGFFQALADDTGINGARLGKAICDSFYTACIAEGQAAEVTLSVVDLGRADTLLDAYYDIGVESLIFACMDTSYFSEFGRAAKKAENYGGNNSWDGYTNMVDLGDLVRQSGDGLLPEYGRTLLDALNECVVYKVNGPYRSRASGLSCYYSYNSDYDDFLGFASLNDENPFRWYYDYAITGELSREGELYVRSLETEYSQAGGVKPEKVHSPQYDNLEDFRVILTDDGYAVLDLGPEIAGRLAGVYCVLAYYDEDEEIIILLGTDNDLDSDWENGVFTDNFRGVWGSIDGILCYMELTDEADDYQLYTVPVLLNGEEYSLSVSYTYDDEEYTILGARRGVDDNGMADKNLRKLRPGDIIEPLHYIFFDLDDDDEDPSQMAVESITVTSRTRFEETDLGDGLFVFMFEMVDVQNNSYLSEAVVFSVEDGEIYLLDDD